MSDQTISDISAGVAGKKTPGAVSLADHALVQLTLVRFLEFVREPEALFWVFIFPILLAAGLGIAFRNRPPDVLRIAAVTPELAQSLRQEKLLDVQQLDAAAAQEALRTGKVALLAVPGASGGIEYRYDETNPEGHTARLLADRAIQKARGTRRSGGHDRPAGARDRLALYRLPDSRSAGNEPDGQRHLGHGIRHRGRAAQEAHEAPDRHAPCRGRTTCSRSCLSRLVLLVIEVSVLVGFGVVLFHVPVRGSLHRPRDGVPAGVTIVQRPGFADCFSGENN